MAMQDGSDKTEMVDSSKTENGTSVSTNTQSPTHAPMPEASPSHPSETAARQVRRPERKSIELGYLGAGLPGRLQSFQSDRDRGALLPKFGDWDVNDPASGVGFTAIFEKAADEKRTGRSGMPSTQGESWLPIRFGGTSRNAETNNKESSCLSRCLDCFGIRKRR